MTIQQILINKRHAIRKVLTLITPLKEVPINCHPMIKSIVRRNHMQPCRREVKCDYYVADDLRSILEHDLAEILNKIHVECYRLSVQIERLQEQLAALKD